MGDKTHVVFTFGLKRRGPLYLQQTQCVDVKKKLTRCQVKLAQGRGLVGHSPPVCKHTARMVKGTGGVKKTSYSASRRVSKTAQDSADKGGLGADPPICKHNSLMLCCKKIICCQAGLHKRGVGGGGGGAAPPPAPFANKPLAR